MAVERWQPAEGPRGGGGHDIAYLCYLLYCIVESLLPNATPSWKSTPETLAIASKIAWAEGVVFSASEEHAKTKKCFALLAVLICCACLRCLLARYTYYACYACLLCFDHLCNITYWHFSCPRAHFQTPWVTSNCPCTPVLMLWAFPGDIWYLLGRPGLARECQNKLY